jgi:HSP20 family molecular chaperone IbpA/ribosome-associated toxin RatA of RatAB toxin-antitoxin module
MNQIEQAIDINAPVKAVYEQCARFSDYPRFMEGVESVRAVDEKHVHWRAMRRGQVVEWSSVITERDPERSIAWQDVDGPHQSSMLRFTSLNPQKTRIQAVLTLAEGQNEFEGGMESLKQRLAGDLDRLKKLLENSGHDWDEWPSTHDARVASAHSIPVGDASAESSQSTQEDASASSQEEEHQRRRDGMHEDAQGHSPRGDAATKAIQGLLQGLDQPLSIVRKMSGEMDQLFERLIGRPMASKWGHGMPGRWAPTVEVAQRAQEFVISVDLPGVAKQDVHIEVHGDKLTIEGERREPGEQKSLPGYRRSERHYGRFYRQVPLPEGTQPDRIRATLLNGVLEIRMPLPPGMGERGRRVDIEDLS